MQTALSLFSRDGYYVARGLVSKKEVDSLVSIINDSLSPALAPVEFEADVHYPGAPTSKNAPGGQTPRRLLHAYGRHPQFQAIGQHEKVIAYLKLLMNSDAIRLSQNHHNCVMTKHPGCGRSE